MISMSLKSIIEELDFIIEESDQIIKDILENELPTITLDFSPLPTLEMIEHNTPDHIKNYDIDISC